MRRQPPPDKLRQLGHFTLGFLRQHSSVSTAPASPEIKYKVNMTPQLPQGSTVVIPISLGRYNLSQEKRIEYDSMLASLFINTAQLLKTGWLKTVDVVSTGGLQLINWDEETVERIESHFFETHSELLEQQSHHYTWDTWLDVAGKDTYEANYQTVLKNSAEGTEWYDLMVKTHDCVQMSESLEQSLEYQRREYAAVMLMHPYNRLVYTGSISSAWAFMYHVFRDVKLPIFTRAAFEKGNKEPLISTADASHTVTIILRLIEDTLTSSNFPKAQKRILVEKATALFHAWGPDVLNQQGSNTAGQPPTPRLK